MKLLAFSTALLIVSSQALAAPTNTFSLGDTLSASKLNTNFNELDAAVSTLNTKASTIESNVAAAEDDIGTIESSVSANTGSISSVSTRVTSLENAGGGSSTAFSDALTTAYAGAPVLTGNHTLGGIVNIGGLDFQISEIRLKIGSNKYRIIYPSYLRDQAKIGLPTTRTTDNTTMANLDLGSSGANNAAYDYTDESITVESLPTQDNWGFVTWGDHDFYKVDVADLAEHTSVHLQTYPYARINNYKVFDVTDGTSSTAFIKRTVHRATTSSYAVRVFTGFYDTPVPLQYNPSVNHISDGFITFGFHPDVVAMLFADNTDASVEINNPDEYQAGLPDDGYIDVRPTSAIDKSDWSSLVAMFAVYKNP